MDEYLGTGKVGVIAEPDQFIPSLHCNKEYILFTPVIKGCAVDRLLAFPDRRGCLAVVGCF